MGLARQGPFEGRNAKERKEQRCGTTRRKFHGPAGLWAIASTTIAAGLSKRPQPSDPKNSRCLFPAFRDQVPRLLNGWRQPPPLCANQPLRFPPTTKPPNRPSVAWHSSRNLHLRSNHLWFSLSELSGFCFSSLLIAVETRTFLCAR